jgi:hypothetical protein
MNSCTAYKLPTLLNNQLESRVNAGLRQLISQPWTMKIWTFLKEIPTIITEIAISNPAEIPPARRFNILAELLSFIEGQHELVANITPADLDHICRILKIIVTNQARGRRITRTQRYMIRKYLEVQEAGIKLINAFTEHVIGQNILQPETELLLNPYTSILNLNEIYMHVNTRYRVTYKFGGSSHKNIFLYLDNGNTSLVQRVTNPVYLQELVARACLFPYLLDSKEMPASICLYLVDYRKEFLSLASKEPVVYTSSEINTGVTDGVNIAITRQEESLKTVLHELCHFYRMDFRTVNTALESKLTKLLNINNKLDTLNLFEAHTETMASFINILCWCWFHGGDTSQMQEIKTKTALLDLVTKPMLDQVIYTFYKMARVLKASNCAKLGDSKGTGCQITQTTNVVSYYIIKPFFYLYLDELGKYCLDPATGKFTENPASLARVETIITRGLNSKLVASILEYLLRKKSGRAINSNSAQMTCHG